MSTNVLSPSVTLTVLNPEKLLHGSEPRHRFDRAGGSIGSQGAWRLHDRGVRILPVHCEIGWHEGHFCIIDHSGKSFMNGSDTQLLSGTPVRLRHNDRLQMGDYQIAIHLARTRKSRSRIPAGTRSPSWGLISRCARCRYLAYRLRISPDFSRPQCLVPWMSLIRWRIWTGPHKPGLTRP
ncbi:FHA domain-containing protein [Pseudomonas asiatica]|uniref:FHA domain-containing protein n=1 Tax=Pseudomonas asiatica TaxID=2219225 RepID=UPI0015AA9046|nr:FHA domain-containing protein [Pseudomonas asiatica]CAB5630321.1 Uncharacterized conserved protein, contains FHA domain [Pseudomonas putida]CAB5640692.1 Uncharacterized conserved protein, contains FHA domain [Pseudomonas putida]CAB5677015.1 Uncharacterized conserved protein, contains FHA domain [Pseudomonas putida]